MQAVKRSSNSDGRFSRLMNLLFSGLFVLTLGGVGWLLELFSDPATLPIRRVQVEGEFQAVQPVHLEQVIAAAVDGGFFSLDMAAIREQVISEPWISDATVRRIWPDTLRVSIVEQVAVACWNDTALLNSLGDVFTPEPSEIPHGLPALYGPQGTGPEVLRMFEELAARLASVEIGVEAVSVSPRKAWTVGISGSRKLVLGRQQVESRLQRFLMAYRSGLNDVWREVSAVDLRYPNGLSVVGLAKAREPVEQILDRGPAVAGERI